MITESQWLGRLDSNQGMAESKSGGSTRNINAHSEKQAESAPSNNNRLAADSECREADIPTDPKAFQRWLTVEGCWTTWPSYLMAKAIRAGHALVGPSTTYWSDYEFRKLCKANWSAFTTAYADHVGGR